MRGEMRRCAARIDVQSQVRRSKVERLVRVRLELRLICYERTWCTQWGIMAHPEWKWICSDGGLIPVRQRTLKILTRTEGKCDSQYPPSGSHFAEQFKIASSRGGVHVEPRASYAPRKSYAIPVRFNVITEQHAMVGVASVATAPAHANAKILTTIPLPQQGEIVNLSERGIGFKTRQNLSVGESVEIFFTLPTALTGRAPEDVRCNARVVRVEKNADIQWNDVRSARQLTASSVRRSSRNWDN